MNKIASSSDPSGTPTPRSQTVKRLLLKTIRWTVLFIVGPIIIGAIVLVPLLNNQRFHSYLLATLQTQASQKLGARVELQNFVLHLSTLSLDLYGLKIHGATPYSDPPLLQVQHVYAGVRIVSVLQSKWYLDSFQVDRPVVQIFVDKNGVSNIPTIKSSGGASTSVFDLGIRHAILENGEVYYNSRPASLALDLHNVSFNTSFNSLLQKYSGTLTYSDGHLTYGTVQPPQHSVTLQFDATPTSFHLNQAKLTTGNSQLILDATVENYNSPAIRAQYKANVDGAQLAEMLHNPSLPAGLISATGSLQYQQIANRPFLETLTINGDLKSRRMVVRTQKATAEIANVDAHYSFANGDAVLQDFRANVLGGEITAQGTMKRISGESSSRFNASVRRVSLAEIRNLLGTTGASPGVAVEGTMNASATASWGKTFDDLAAHADATMNGRVANRQQGATATTIPVEGVVHATYYGNGQRLALDNSYLRTPQTNIAMNGVVSTRSSLALQVQANDLREIEAVANIFRESAAGTPPQPIGLSGTASFQGVVQGSVTVPHLTGQLTAQNLQANGTTWKVLRAHVDVSPSQVSLQQGDLEPASKGKVSFNATAGLQKWSFSSASPITLQLNASQMDLSELEKLLNRQIPVTGTVSANVALHGTTLSPIGKGSVTLADATAYGEPISNAQVTFSGNGDEAHADLSIRATAGALQGRVTIRPNQKTYTAQISSANIQLAKLEALKSRGADVTGVVNISATGKGTFDNPQMTATVEIPTLGVQQESITDIRLQANVADHVGTAKLTSTAANASISANAKVSLLGDFPADATLDTQGIALGPLLAAYAPGEAANLTGQTEIHATLHGPLKQKEQLEAHVTVPVLNLAYGKNVSMSAAAPIHVDFKNGVIDVQRSTIRGTNTDLQFQGSIPIDKNAPMSLLLVGAIDLQLAQLFDPDLKSSGQVKFNINSYGSNGRDIGGSIDIVNANFSSADLPVGLQNANGSLAVTPDRINITKFEGTIGGGTVTAQGGIALRPSIHFDVGLVAKGVRMLYLQGMREGLDANLRFTGTTEAASLGGSVNLTDLSFTNAFDLGSFVNQFSGGIESPPSQGFSRNIALNLAVRSSSNVNLVSRTLSVGGSANLQVRGTVAEPVVLGRAILTRGDIILNGSRYLLTGGTIQFVNPSQTEPVINLTLTTTIQQYNISMRFQGPIEQLHTQYSSDPSLPSADIINLLAFGKTTEASANSATPSNQAAQSVVASQVSSQITSRVSKIAGISQLSINPVLSGSSNQGPPGANITIQQRVTGNLFVTFSTNVATTQGQTVQGQYQVSPRVAVSATRDANGGFGFDTFIKKTW